MCQGMTVKRKTAGEVDLADKGQTSQRKLEINGSAGYAPCAHKQVHARTHPRVHTPGKHTIVEFDAKIDLSGARQKNLRETYRQTQHTNETLPPLYLTDYIQGAPQQSPPPISLSS